jgi:hypothetical protein
MKTLLASDAGLQSAAQAAFFMTWAERPVGIALRKVPAVQGFPSPSEAPPQTIEIGGSAGVIVRVGSSF